MSRKIADGDRIRLTGLNVTRRHRTLDERILARFPALARVSAYFQSRLRTGSRLRRLLLVRRASQAASAVNRRDFDLLFSGFDPAIDFRIVSAAGGGGVIPPDLVGHHHGYAAYRDMWSAMLEAFEDMTLEAEELLDLGDRLISVTRMRGHGAGSGVPVDQLLFQVFTFRRGLVVKQEDFGSWEEALEAAGRRE